MKNILTIAGKELKTYFTSPIAYFVMGVYLIISGYLFSLILSRFSALAMMLVRNPMMMERLNVNDMVMQPLVHNMNVILLFVIPLLTMRLIAEEKKTGTMELLMTSPVSLGEVALGKYLGALGLYVILMALMSPYGIVLVVYGNPDIGPLLTGYLSIFLIGASFLAVGLFASSLTQSQLIAAVICFGILLLLWLIGWAADSAGGTLGDILNGISLANHSEDMVKGLVDTKDVVFFLSFIFFWTFLSQQVLDAKRWK